MHCHLVVAVKQATSESVPHLYLLVCLDASPGVSLSLTYPDSPEVAKGLTCCGVPGLLTVEQLFLSDQGQDRAGEDGVSVVLEDEQFRDCCHAILMGLGAIMEARLSSLKCSFRVILLKL